jgi:hypothetical protein
MIDAFGRAGLRRGYCFASDRSLADVAAAAYEARRARMASAWRRDRQDDRDQRDATPTLHACRGHDGGEGSNVVCARSTRCSRISVSDLISDFRDDIRRNTRRLNAVHN